MALSRAAATAATRVALPRAVAPAMQGAPRRFVGGSAEELAAGTDMWLKASVVGLLAFTIPFSFYMAYVEANHEHHEKKIFPHMKIRHKKFAWANSDCDIFDGHCHAEANAAKASA